MPSQISLVFWTVWVSHLNSVQLINTPFHGTVLELTLIIHTSLISLGLLKSVKVILNNGDLWVKPMCHFLKIFLLISPLPNHVTRFYWKFFKNPVKWPTFENIRRWHFESPRSCTPFTLFLQAAQLMYSSGRTTLSKSHYRFTAHHSLRGLDVKPG